MKKILIMGLCALSLMAISAFAGPQDTKLAASGSLINVKI